MFAPLKIKKKYILELENALKSKNIDILYLSEVRKSGKEILKTKEGNIMS